MTPLFSAMLSAPLVAVSKRWPTTLHAAEMGEICRAWPNGTITAPCGASRLRLLTFDGSALPWPPAVRELAPRVRCRECWLATGKKRPRSVVARRPVAA